MVGQVVGKESKVVHKLKTSSDLNFTFTKDFRVPHESEDFTHL